MVCNGTTWVLPPWLSIDARALSTLSSRDTVGFVASVRFGANVENLNFAVALSDNRLFRKTMTWINGLPGIPESLRAAVALSKRKQSGDRKGKRTNIIIKALLCENALEADQGDGMLAEAEADSQTSPASELGTSHSHNMSGLKILQTYARRAPESLPASILFKHSEKNITIFDAFPKSKFHFLVLPRVVQSGPSLDSLESLQSLLKADKAKAQEVVAALAEEARSVKAEIQAEMVKHYGFKWDVWTGFHAAPSMVHLHLHVLSADLCSDRLKHKKHYNSFHPKLGFFLHLDDVLSWFDADPTYYATMVKQLTPSNYDPKLKENLVCFHCHKEMKNIPTLKTHLDEEWSKLERVGMSNSKRKREVVEENLAKSDESEKDPKKAKSDGDVVETLQ